MITFMAYALIVVFMILIMAKKMSPFAALTIIPIIFGVIGQIFGFWTLDLGVAALEGVKTTSTTAICKRGSIKSYDGDCNIVCWGFVK